MNRQFSFIIITFNEQIHLPRLLSSIKDLAAPLFVLDSGSTDETISIAEAAGATVLQHAFENHPKQWHFALNNFNVKTPWVICLDADQVVTPELKQQLLSFNDEAFTGVNGIYFNRKNYFKGRWIKHGGYFPLYLLKMFRFGKAYSDLNENMDHRFIVEGETMVWKSGYLLEENLKENNISFWINKHNRYSDLVAQEEVERMLSLRTQTIRPRFWGSPDERTAWLKQIWWKMPRYARPMIYFLYRIIFQLGILDGQTGVIFHFLQAFWFRLIVDVKIDEILQNQQGRPNNYAKANNNPLRFVMIFLLLFGLFYYSNIFVFRITQPGDHYNYWVANNLNYIHGLRWLLLSASAQILSWFGFAAIFNEYDLLVAGHGTIQLVYSCLGLGLMSFFAAFVIAYPKKWGQKLVFLVCGMLGIQLLNIARFVLLALFWDKHNSRIVDHHAVFNAIIYVILAGALYFWVKQGNDFNNKHAKN